ncbi:hypothetical protein C2845_PM14G21090 [Panicum miliaceum]|uniref:Uncharacterized protein n=1 Tax=Panicum miliaceum TaxID=4540 RepID=A0A3L6PU60_PANMI|nr:hypothetical protein C2845_PM14G21090 [Panicum miliaceum]
MQAAYFKMYEQLTYKMDEEAQANIRLKLPYIEEWRKRFNGNRLLEGIYYFKPKTYEVSEPEQQPHQLTFQEQVEQDKKRKKRRIIKNGQVPEASNCSQNGRCQEGNRAWDGCI